MTKQARILDDIKALAERAYAERMTDVSLGLTAILEDATTEGSKSRADVIALEKEGINLLARTIMIGGKEVMPSRSLFAVCAYLARRPKVVRSMDSILNALGANYDVSEMAVRTSVKKIRKLGVTAIHTAYGEGFYWDSSRCAVY